MLGNSVFYDRSSCCRELIDRASSQEPDLGHRPSETKSWLNKQLKYEAPGVYERDCMQDY